MSKTFQLLVPQGGRLITDLSLASIGPANYGQKINFRRERDQEMRREGWIKFTPLPVIANQHVFDPSEDCIKMGELTRPNGERAVIGCSRTKIKKFNSVTGAWDTIGSGFSSSGVRWQICTCNGFAVFNNGVDLPVSWRVEDATVTPIYEMREVGIASVGRIEIFNSFLMLADITEIQPEVLPLFMRGWSTFTVDATQAKNANFSINNSTENKDQFNVTTAASVITATLPSAPPTDFYVWIKKQDNGAGSVITSPAVAVTPVNLTTQNDIALVWWDATNERWASVTFPLGVIPADTQFGIPPSYITNHYPWKIINGEYGEPRNFAPVFSVLMPSASATITLPFASSVFIAGQTRVAVIGGGPLGGALGGQSDSPLGILVTAVSGRTLTLETSTDASLTYPRVVQVVRWEDVSSLVGSYSIQGDNSSITGLNVLRDWLVVSRETGFYLGQYTGDPAAPFRFTPKYAGSNVPMWGDAIANIKGDYLLYPARGNRMFFFDAISYPQVHEITDGSASLFFEDVDETTEVFATDNPITKEIFFCYPETTLCFDYDESTLSVFDQAFDAGAGVHRPASTDEWFAMAIGRFIYVYGLVYGVTPINTWLRDGVVAEGVLRFGLNSFGDQSNEKLLQNYTPLFASQSPDSAVEVQLYSAWNANATPEALLTPVESLPTPEGRNYIPTAFMALYFSDEITVVETDDIDLRFSGRIFEMELVKASGVTRSIPV